MSKQRHGSRRRLLALTLTAATALSLGLSTVPVGAAPPEGEQFSVSPIDPQNWQNQYDMTWDDWVDIPNTDWNDPSGRASQDDLSVALVAVDFPDQPFVITQPKGSDPFGNPQIDPIPREDVADFYRDYYMEPSELNAERTIHEYWMEQSRGTYGIDYMDAYGPVRVSRNLYEYGLNEFNQQSACPEGKTCNGNMDRDVDNAWKESMGAKAGVTGNEWCATKAQELGGNARNCGYDVILRIYAGYDETSIWQEFGEMMFPTKESIPEEWGPPEGSGELNNWAPTRYVEWTSWRAAAQQWGLSSIRQAESSGTITHEIGHFFFQVGDNNNNPFALNQNPPGPLRRVGSAPWDMMDRGSFNGPGGHHMRWVVPANQGGWSPAGLMLRNKRHMGLLPDENLVRVERDSLEETGLVLDTVTARAADPGEKGTSGLWIEWPHADDKTPACDINSDPMCDGGSWDNYTVEVVDRMGFDSFTPDSGVLIAKNKWGNEQNPEGGGQLGYRNGEDSKCGHNCMNWVIDANPQDIDMVDYYKPTVAGEWATGGEPVMATIADHRQLNDALFKAGTNSGSQQEWVDEANGLHFYVVDLERDADGVLSYQIAVRSLDGAGPHTRGVSADDAEPSVLAEQLAAQCAFPVTNTGSVAPIEAGTHPTDVTDKVDGDVFRLSAKVDGEGWAAELNNTLAAARSGQSSEVPVFVYPTVEGSTADEAVVTLTAVSESDPTKQAEATCVVELALLEGETGPSASPSVSISASPSESPTVSPSATPSGTGQVSPSPSASPVVPTLSPGTSSPLPTGTPTIVTSPSAVATVNPTSPGLPATGGSQAVRVLGAGSLIILLGLAGVVIISARRSTKGKSW